MIIKAIASSSNGNCYSISDGSSTLLVECGVPISQIRREVDLTKIEGCLISHEHQDHCKAATDVVKFVPIYTSSGTIEALKIDKMYDYKLKSIKHGESKTIGSFVVSPFNTQHDAAEPLGFLIYSTVTNEKLLFVTDTYYIHYQFKGLNYIMVECNYSKDLITNGLSKTEYNRLIQSHFELENVKKFLDATDLSKCRQIYLMHLSDRNSDEARFKKEIQELTGIPVEVCRK